MAAEPALWSPGATAGDPRVVTAGAPVPRSLCSTAGDAATVRARSPELEAAPR